MKMGKGWNFLIRLLHQPKERGWPDSSTWLHFKMRYNNQHKRSEASEHCKLVNQH
jgi:hypothetical protein